MSVPATAFVTGGSGFIGGALVERLVDASGVTVSALARSASSAAAVERRGARAARGDLDDPALADRRSRGLCRSPSTSPPISGQWGTCEEFARGNVSGTENALAASRRAGVRRFVHCSTEAALIAGQAAGRDRRDGAAAPRLEGALLLDQGAGRDPGSSRRRSRARDGRPAAADVWGRGDTTLLPSSSPRCEAGRFAWIGGGRHRTDTTHVDNVVEGLLLSAARGRSGEAYFVTDGGTVVFREFISELLATQGVEAPSRSVPAWLAGGGAAIAEATWRLLRLGGEPPLTRFAVWLSSQECTIEIGKARRELGYEPVISSPGGAARAMRARLAPTRWLLEPSDEQLRVQGADQVVERPDPGLDDLQRRARGRDHRRAARSAP